MDALAIAWAVASVAIAGVLTFITLCVTGQLVPGARLEKAQAAADHFEDAYETVKALAERFGLLSDMTGAVLRATQQVATTPPAAPVTAPQGTP